MKTHPQGFQAHFDSAPPLYM